ncbi:MAG: HupE/UreJ family protein [Sphingomicrobium sp.]
MIDHRRGSKNAVLAAALMLASPAAAHTGSGGLGGFVAGIEHPLTGIDHLLAMVSVGIWGAILGRPLLIALPVVFPGMMAVGGLLGLIHLPFPRVELGIALSVLLLGGAIALEWRASVWAAVVLVGVFALFHGYAHGRELPRAADPVYYSLGFMLATGSLHVAGIGIGLVHDRPGGPAVTRLAGGIVAVAGVRFLWQALV